MLLRVGMTRHAYFDHVSDQPFCPAVAVRKLASQERINSYGIMAPAGPDVRQSLPSALTWVARALYYCSVAFVMH